jgi:hypothetical protein
MQRREMSAKPSSAATVEPDESQRFHSQVVRMNMFKGNEFAFQSAAARNADALQLLLGVNSKSVWRNYELISTMWPTNTGKCQAAPGDPLGTPAPNFSLIPLSKLISREWSPMSRRTASSAQQRDDD